MKYGRYTLIFFIGLHVSIDAMLPSTARYSKAFLLNASRNTQKLAPHKFESIGQTVTKRASRIKLQTTGRPFSSSSLSTLMGKPSFSSPVATQSWWHTPAKTIATLAGGVGLTKASIYLYRQWDLLKIETFTNQARSDLASISPEQILKHIETLEYYIKIDDPNIASKANGLLNELRNLYITKKYQEMSMDAFLENIKKNPGAELLKIKRDVLFVHNNAVTATTVPEVIVAKLAALKNTPAADSLLSELEKEISTDVYTVHHDSNKYFLTKAEQSLAALNGIKNIIMPDRAAQLDQPEPHSFDSREDIFGLPF